MNKFRKQIFVSSICSSFVLFIFGVTLLAFINKSDSQADSGISNILNLSEYAPLKEPINVLMLGGDRSNGITDTIMIVNYNPKNSQVSILSIPRDTRAIHNRNKVKINSIYGLAGKNDLGCESLKSSINDLLNIKIDYYVYIDLDVFKNVIDELGGIDYNVPCNMYYKDSAQNLDINIKKGKQHLDGNASEGIMRFRKPDAKKYTTADLNELKATYDGSDLKRIDVQQGFLKEVIRQKSSIASLSKVQDILSIVFNRLSTNIDMKTTVQIGSNLGNMSSDKIKAFKIAVSDINDGTGDVLYTNYITDNSNKENYPAKEILDKYFSTNSENWSIKKSTDDSTNSPTSTATTETTTATPSNILITKTPVKTIVPTSTPIIHTKTPVPTIIITNTPTPTIPPTPIPTKTTIAPTPTLIPSNSSSN